MEHYAQVASALRQVPSEDVECEALRVCEGCAAKLKRMPQADSNSNPNLEAAKLLAHPPFVRFWLARLSGMLSNQMLMLAVAWQMHDLTSSAWDLGLVG